MSVLVTGGAGYIGAHIVRLLQQSGAQAVVVDDLSTVDRTDHLGDAAFVRLDLATAEAPEVLEATLREHEVSAVVHLAARKQVGESVQRPAWYYQQNVGGLANVVAAMEKAGVATMIFSSSAAVYGTPHVDLVTEDSPTEPINPYGRTKLIGEWLVADAARAWGLRSVSLRYFNVAGAGWPDLGDPAVLNLVPMVLDRLASGRRPAVFGQDYPTPDGTCVRDYIHVGDLADAHIAALRYLEGASEDHSVFNVGTGAGASVSEVIDEIGRVSGLDVTPEIGERRPGDPARLVASADRIAEVLGWRASNGLPEIIASAWEAWQAGPRRIG